VLIYKLKIKTSKTFSLHFAYNKMQTTIWSEFCIICGNRPYQPHKLICYFDVSIAILNELWKNREEEIKAKTWKN